ncbi:hypothetical protein [Halogeometricum limi]|uniref:DUF8048 domain-containing protein n=1 Tax=Halogeometricum limi TaxID=555875 RepID=A0A1I6G3B4_9EURY|nr:hypothetical protein [Halogeometricum limi]SFR36694.1 hypothetical protein SAMN04488124_0806 [Halogeometricum limi]
MTDETAIPIESSVVERVAEESGVDSEGLMAALVELDATLIGQHSTLERSGDYVSVDDTRAYRISRERLQTVLNDFTFDERIEAAVVRAHTEQADQFFASATHATEGFDEGEVGIVVGVNTAEEF